MSASSFKATYLALLVMAGFASTVRAQLDDPNSPFYGPANDMRFFEPVDLDINEQGMGRRNGFWFRYEKIAQATTGERVEIGDPNTDQINYQVYGGTPLDPDTGVPLVRPIMTNSIYNAVPRAVFDLGDRYEFGYWGEKNVGWSFSIINGPDNNQGFTLGFAEDDPLFNPQDSVFVSFRTAPGNLAGFLDVVLADGSVDFDGDGFVDDWNANGQYGPMGFDTDNDGIPDLILAVLPDYGDLVNLTTGYAQVSMRNSLNINGFEMMRGHRMDNSHFMVKNQNNYFDWSVGARFLQYDDNFLFTGTNGLTLGDGRWDTQIVNNIVGPQVGFNWQHQRGRWSIESMGKFMFGYNIRDWSQDGYILAGPDSEQAAANNSLLLRGKSFSYGRNDDDFSPVAELRLNTSYALTDSVSLTLGYTATFADNIKRASTHVDYVLYDEAGKVMGFRDGDTEELFSSAVTFGVQIVQ